MTVKQQTSYEVIVQEDSDSGDLILPIPQELLNQMGWKEGDQLEWQETDNHSYMLVKVNK